MYLQTPTNASLNTAMSPSSHLPIRSAITPTSSHLPTRSAITPTSSYLLTRSAITPTPSHLPTRSAMSSTSTYSLHHLSLPLQPPVPTNDNPLQELLLANNSAHSTSQDAPISPTVSSSSPLPSPIPATPNIPAVPSATPVTSAVPATPNIPATNNTQSDDERLLQPDEVLFKYPKLLHISLAGRLAVRLACESYFGKRLLQKCTVYGHGSFPPLPKEKVMELKKKILNLYPQFISSPLEFEPTWTKCINVINHCASRLRATNPPSLE